MRTTTGARFAVYAETTTTGAGRTSVAREALEDDEGRLRTFPTAGEAIAAWEETIRMSGAEPREFAREGASRFYEVVTPGGERSVLFHVRVRRVAG